MASRAAVCSHAIVWVWDWTWAMQDARSWKRNSVPKRREAEESSEESILQTEFRFQEERSSG